MVFKASTGHALVVAKNILASIKGGKEAYYAGKPEIIMITLGPLGGRGYMPFFGGVVLGNWMISKMKARDLFIDKTRARLGYS